MSSGSDDDLYRIEWDSIRTRRRKAFDLASHKAVSEDTGSGTPADDRPPKIESSSTTEQSEFAHEQSEFAQRPKDLVGLSLSGGGLRSALFNDGLLQAFSHRGLLRYVDYLSSVSGGAYIAGHLMSYSTNAAAKSRNFHNDPCGEGSGSKPVWHLGRDPVNGQEDHDRLPAIGSYLKRSAQFLAGYCLRQLPVILLYLSFFGFLATLLALFYRSYDAPLFRAVYFRLLDVQYLNELLIAFIPALITAAVTLGLALVAWSPMNRCRLNTRLCRLNTRLCRLKTRRVVSALREVTQSNFLPVRTEDRLACIRFSVYSVSRPGQSGICSAKVRHAVIGHLPGIHMNPLVPPRRPNSETIPMNVRLGG